MLLIHLVMRFKQHPPHSKVLLQIKLQERNYVKWNRGGDKSSF